MSSGTNESMKPQIQKVFSQGSARVKCVDLHPINNWVLVSLYDGTVELWDYIANSLIKSIEVTDVPVRSSKFIIKNNDFVCGSDDKKLRFYNYNTNQLIKQIDAHNDYIRGIETSESLSMFLTCSDDLTIKLWDYNNYTHKQTFEGHTHYIMNVKFNPKDNTMFVSCSLDKSIKMWNINSKNANYTIQGHHKKGINYVEFYTGNNDTKPYIITGADDKKIMVFDYLNKSCIQSIDDHTNNVSFCSFLKELPIIVSGSEDGDVMFHNSITFNLINKINYNLDRAWCISNPTSNNNNTIAIGFENGFVVLTIGSLTPTCSMDCNGKIIAAKGAEILALNIKEKSRKSNKLELENTHSKNLGVCDIFPSNIKHSPNGRFVAVFNNTDYIIYTQLAWRNKSFGSCQQFVWCHNSTSYATLLNGKIKIFKNFKEINSKSLLDTLIDNSPSYVEKIFGGALLGIYSNNSLVFLDWESFDLIRRIEVDPEKIIWNSENTLCAIIQSSETFILRYNSEKYEEYIQNNNEIEDNEDGLEEAFDIHAQIQEQITNATFITKEALLFKTKNNKICYCINDDYISNIVQLEKNGMDLLTYNKKDENVYVVDKNLNIYTINLPLNIIKYQLFISQNNMEEANKIKNTIDENHKNKIADYLIATKKYELAIEIANDENIKFNLSIKTNRLKLASQIAEKINTISIWNTLANKAIQENDIKLAINCLEKSNNKKTLFMIYDATGNFEKIKELAKDSEKEDINFALLCYIHTKNYEKIIEILQNNNRFPEAAIFAKNQKRQTKDIVENWKEFLNKKGFENFANLLKNE